MPRAWPADAQIRRRGWSVEEKQAIGAAAGAGVGAIAAVVGMAAWAGLRRRRQRSAKAQRLSLPSPSWHSSAANSPVREAAT